MPEKQPPKKIVTFRLAAENITILQDYAKAHSLENTTEALEKILAEVLSPTKSLKDSVPASSASDLLPCKQRVTIANELTCMNPPTLYKKVKITEITPEVCRACQVLSKNLPEKYEIKPTPTEETFDRPREPVRQPNKELEKVGMVWCPQDTLMVFAEKCGRCREKNLAIWRECQKQKYLQKGEQLRKSTANDPSF